MNVFGFDVTTIPPRGENWVEMVDIDLGDQRVEMPTAVHDKVLDAASDAASYRAGVLAAKAQEGSDWARDRGPDSDLGRNIEQGTPSADHSSDPI